MGRQETRVLCFIDILGFKNIIKRWLEDPNAAVTVEASLNRAAEWVGGRRALISKTVHDWRLRVFSDCACISQPATDLGILSLLEGAAFFQRELIGAGYLIRGGISMGKHFESAYTLLSDALLDAHELESVHAITPRVLLSPRVLLEIDSIPDDEVRKELKELVTIDADGLSFLNYMVFQAEDEWLGGHDFYLKQRDLLTLACEDMQLPAPVREKYIWMSMFHNWCVRETAHLLRSSGRLTEDDVWSFSSLLVKPVAKERRFVSALWLDRAFDGEDYTKRHQGIDWTKEWPGVRTEDDEPEDYV